MSFSSQLVISELNIQYTKDAIRGSSRNLKRSFVEVARTETCSQHSSLFPASHSLFWYAHPTAAPHSLLHSPDELLPPAGASRHTLHREPVSWTFQLLGVWLFKLRKNLDAILKKQTKQEVLRPSPTVT